MIGAFLVALGGTFALTGAMVPLLRRWQFIDVPNHRSSHTRPVPRGGGLAVVAILVAVAGVATESSTSVSGLLIGTLVLSLLGLVDDSRSLPTKFRLCMQGLVAVGVSALFISSSDLWWWWLPILVIGVVGYVNAFNFMDGINGISSATAAVVGLWWAWAGQSQGETDLAVLGLVLAGSSLGFLPWNAPSARVFLGDVGSYGIGAYIAGLSGLALAQGLPWWWAVAPLVVYGADTGWVLLKRARSGKKLTEAHREHVYQRLVDGGWAHLPIAMFCAGVTGLVCLAAAVQDGGLSLWSVVAGLLIVLLYLSSPHLMARRVEAA